AVEAATWPEGNAWYFVLKRGAPQRSSDFTDGRALGIVRLIAVPATPAIAIATNIDKKIRIHFLLWRRQAIPTSSNPRARCDGQSPYKLTLRMKVRIMGF